MVGESNSLQPKKEIAEPIQVVPVSSKKKSWWSRYSKTATLVAIWVGFFLVLYLFRSFLSLVFLTFILSYSINSLSLIMQRNLTWPRWGVVLIIYVLLGIFVVSIGMIVFPRVYQESKSMTREIPEAKDKLLASIRQVMADPDYAKFLEGIGVEETAKDWIAPVVQSFTLFLQNFFRTSFHVLLSLVFSFLIIWDLERLKCDVKALKDTRLGLIYETISPMLEKFGTVVGKAFEAQIMIAFVNTILTLIGLTLLGVPSQLFLSVFVFICSFIPVLGMIFSSLPICLMAYKTQGVILVVYSVIMVAVIHFIEAYILNPRIVGGHFSLHPFIAVCLLVVSETWFGVWGLLLGVPVAVFVYQTIIAPGVANTNGASAEKRDKKVPVEA